MKDGRKSWIRTGSRSRWQKIPYFDFKAGEELYSLGEHNLLTYKEGLAILNKLSPKNINNNNKKKEKKTKEKETKIIIIIINERNDKKTNKQKNQRTKTIIHTEPNATNYLLFQI